MQATIDVDNNSIVDALSLALGNFSNWARESENNEAHITIEMVVDGVDVLDIDEVDDDGDIEYTYELNRQNIQQGLQLMAQHYPEHLGNLLDEQYDAYTGDLLLQLSLLGEERYA